MQEWKVKAILSDMNTEMKYKINIKPHECRNETQSKLSHMIAGMKYKTKLKSYA